MPPKTVVCSVCGQEVLKAQTLEVSPGKRACRSHEGTPAASAQVQQAAKEAEAKRRAAIEEKRRSWMRSDPADYEKFKREMEEWRLWSHTHCWTCGKPGITMQEFFFSVLVTHKKLELEGRWNFMTLPQDVRAELGHQTVLAPVPYDWRKDGFIRRRIVDKRIKDIIDLLGMVQTCVNCAHEMRIEDRVEALIPKPTWEQIESMLPVVHLLDPLLTELATTQGEN